MAVVFRVLSTVVSAYTFLCFVRIVLTWIPGASSSKITRALAAICDPYLNLFRGIKWLVVGSFNFSPALALCVLGAVSMLLTSFSHQGRVTVGLVLAMVIQLAWSLVHSLLIFFMLLLLVRIIMLFVQKGSSTSPILNQIDYSIKPIVYRIVSPFARGGTMPYRTALIAALVMLFVATLVLTLLVSKVTGLIAAIPF